MMIHVWVRFSTYSMAKIYEALNVISTMNNRCIKSERV